MNTGRPASAIGGSADRAVLLVDGNNWYHSLKEAGVVGALDYGALSHKLIGPRLWVGTRYYIGVVKHYHPSYSGQRRFLAYLENHPSRKITVHRGRIEHQPKPNPLADELLRLLGRWPGLDRDFRSELVGAIDRHRNFSLFKEKAADVMVAVDMCRMAFDDLYDAAYLLSADGDFTPAVEFVKAAGKKVYVASPAKCYALGQVARYILLQPQWFADVRLP